MREKSWEYVGRSVEEATQIALEELGLERDDVFIEILEEPQKGFLGLGGKEARIRVEMIGEWEVLGKKEELRKSDEPDVADQDSVEDLQEVEPSESSDSPAAMVREIIKMFGVEAKVESKERDESVVVEVWGDDVAILIGKGGATLDSLQYIVNICCRRTGEVSKRIIVDVEGYRKRRKAKLEKIAEQSANKAISQKKSVVLDPMSASERKIVHIALRNMEGVTTESSGEGPDRHIVIHPEGNSASST
jgi:spoIIIJ-associated protein